MSVPPKSQLSTATLTLKSPLYLTPPCRVLRLRLCRPSWLPCVCLCHPKLCVRPPLLYGQLSSPVACLCNGAVTLSPQPAPVCFCSECSFNVGLDNGV